MQKNLVWKKLLSQSTIINWMSIKMCISPPAKPQVQEIKTAMRKDEQLIFAHGGNDPNLWL